MNGEVCAETLQDDEVLFEGNAKVGDTGRFLLKQTNGPPVQFRGTMIGTAGRRENPGKFDRWHEVNLYKTTKGSFVVQILWRSAARHKDGTPVEIDQDDVFVFKSPREVIDFLTLEADQCESAEEYYDPLQYLVGYHVGVLEYERKQSELRKRILDQFSNVAGDVLMKASEHDDSFIDESDMV